MSPYGTYQFYSQRGDAENRIKELKQGLEMGRTSCSSFRANQLRLRERLLKLPVWVEESVRRVVLHLPTIFLAKDDWLRIALAVGGHSP